MAISLHGQKVHLRALEPEDLDILFQWENNPSIWQVSNTRTPFSLYTLKQYLTKAHEDINEIKQLRLVISLNEPVRIQRPIGLIDLFEFDPFHQRSGIGILIADEKDQGQGFAREALELLLGYAFQTLLLHLLFCSVTEGNDRSIRLFEAAGFIRTGSRPDWIRTAAGWIGEHHYQLSREDWINRS